jgi:hypothetical protein
MTATGCRDRGRCNDDLECDHDDRSDRSPASVSRPSPRSAYRLLVARGFASAEAGNLTAIMAGIPIVTEPWTAREVSHLVFLRTLFEPGTWDPDDGAPRGDAAL